MNEKNTRLEEFLEKFDDTMEKSNVITDAERDDLASIIPDRVTLEDGLPELLHKSDDMKSSIDDCDKKIKIWQESKKLWSARQKNLMDILELTMKKLGIPNQSIKANGIKLATNTRTTLEVDEEWLINLYESLSLTLQAKLPDYIKVSLSLDKTKLNAHLKTDQSMLVQFPEKIHTKSSTSTTIKA